MARLIDADELLEHAYRDKLDSRELIAAMINNAPTVKEIPMNVPLSLVIKALEQESYMGWYDVPSDEMTLEQARQAVKDLRKKLAEYLEQEPKTGHWIPMEVSSGRDSWKCSVCGRRARGKLKNLPYCHCGARMSEVSE